MLDSADRGYLTEGARPLEAMEAALTTDLLPSLRLGAIVGVPATGAVR